MSRHCTCTRALLTAPRLSRILANILRDLYGIKPPSSEDRYRLAAKYNTELNTWRASLAYLLDTSGVDPSLFLPIFLRQRNVLNLAFWHAQILVHRPFLLSNFAGLTTHTLTRSTRHPANPKHAHHVQRCLDAATHIVRVVDDLTAAGQIYSSYWFTHYFAFCAVVVLYVHAIQQRQAPPDTTYVDCFRAAARCHDQLASVATTKGSLAERYAVVLQELRLELLRHNEFLASGETSLPPPPPPPPLLATDLVFSQAAAAMEPEAGGLQHDVVFAEPSPSDSVAQMTGWGQFDSLVTGGIGSLECLLGDGGWDLDLGGGGGLGGIA